MHPKSDSDNTDAENLAYLSENQGTGLRAQSAEDAKEADGSCTLNRPLSELAARRAESLSAGVIGAETRRSKSGPALALKAYLEKPNNQRLEWLTKAVLTAQGRDTAGWEAHAAAVKEAAEDPTNHPLDCTCGDCP